jgi:formylglycine-generating enzyme required for sulfatase activity
MTEQKGPWGIIFQTVVILGGLILSILAGQRSATRWITIPTDQEQTINTELMVFIPAGEFLMGSDFGREDEAPAHQVYLDGYWIDQYEVTNQEYLEFIEESKTSPPRYWESDIFPPGQNQYPVVGVRWKDALAYCEWAGKRLPTEAEWEKACRGTQGRIYPWGNSRNNQLANTMALPEGPHSTMWDDAWELLTTSPGENQPTLMPVGSYPEGVSPYGIYDLIGNASEWVADYYNWEGYWQVSNINPLVLEPTWNHVLRGSAWLMPYGVFEGEYDPNRCAARSSSHGDTRDARMGFRCARSENE